MCHAVNPYFFLGTFAEMQVAGLEGYCTVRLAVVERWSDPELPVIVIVNVPVGVPGVEGGAN